MPADRRVAIRVPATTANLGPGFDCLGMALQLYNRVEIALDDTGKCAISLSGSAGGLDSVPTDESNLVYRAAKRVFDACGFTPPGIRMQIEINTPLARGLGSSASAIVGGMAAANALTTNPMDDDHLLFEMCKMEGHPDNVVACYKGGLTASLMLDDSVVYERHQPHNSIRCVLLIPNYELSTAKARQAIPRNIQHRDAVFNLCRVPFVISRLCSGNLSNLAELADDRLHQPYRKPLIREYDTISSEAEKAGAAAVCISGAGPTILAIATKESAPQVAVAMETVLKSIGVDCRAEIAKPATTGATHEALA